MTEKELDERMSDLKKRLVVIEEWISDYEICTLIMAEAEMAEFRDKSRDH